MKRTTAMVLGLLAAALATAPKDRAQAAENPEFSQDPCGQNTRMLEQRESIPDNLLTAISLAESGRYDADSRASIAWPWTVTANGRGVFFDTKEQAIDAVRVLQRKGLSNIDVGCMQINLHYHPEAFNSLDDAFDPTTNVTYAANYLRALRKDTASWREAAGIYHSVNPEKAQLYREKLARLAGLARDVAVVDAPDKQQVSDKTPSRAEREIDQLRTEALNAAYRSRKDGAQETDFAAKRAEQLQAWREARSDPSLYKSLIAAQTYARQRSMQKRAPDAEADFAAKRRAQLAAWRNTRDLVAARR